MANYLDPYAAELQGIQRQQKLAEMLMQQGQQQPQEQMVSGRVAPINPLQAFLPALNTYQGMNLSKNVEAETKKLADLVRGKNAEEVTKFFEEMQKNPDEAIKMGAMSNVPFLQQGANALLQNKFKEDVPLILAPGAKAVKKTGEVLASNVPEKKLHTVNGNLVDENGNIVFKAPKEYAPHAPQIIDTEIGKAVYDPNKGTTTPLMMNGQPLPPKLTSEQTKDIVGINQQRATIKGAIDAVKDMPSAFSIGRGMAQSLPLGETIAGRFDKPEEAQARAYVFNNVSSVIKERAGTAQSAQELSRINSFLPSKDDSAQQIINKLEGFNKFLADQEKGTRVNPNIPNQPTTPKNNSIFNAADAILKGGK